MIRWPLLREERCANARLYELIICMRLRLLCNLRCCTAMQQWVLLAAAVVLAAAAHGQHLMICWANRQRCSVLLVRLRACVSSSPNSLLWCCGTSGWVHMC
jgi:hypothetical protein